MPNGLCHWIRTNPLASEANNSSSLLTINKSFIRPHLDYRDKIYDQPNNGLSEKIEPIWYNAALAIAGSIRGTSKEIL